MYEAQDGKPDALSAEINRRVINGEYEFLLQMAGQRDSLPDIREAAKANVELAAVIAIINSSAKREFKPLMKMARDKRLSKDVRRFAEMEAENIIREDIGRCVSNGWYKLLFEMERAGLPKNSKKEIHKAAEAAALKEIELCSAAGWSERILDICKDKRLPDQVRALAKKAAASCVSSDGAREEPVSGFKVKTGAPPTGFLRLQNNRDDKERRNWQQRLRRILRF